MKAQLGEESPENNEDGQAKALEQSEGDAGDDDQKTDESSASNPTGEADSTASSTIQEMSEDIYIVQKGDTLAKISKKRYGDIGHVDAICRMNGLEDGNLIFIGQKLLLP